MFLKRLVRGLMYPLILTLLVLMLVLIQVIPLHEAIVICISSLIVYTLMFSYIWVEYPVVNKWNIKQFKNMEKHYANIVVFVTHRPYGRELGRLEEFYNRATISNSYIAFIYVRYQSGLWESLRKSYTNFGPGTVCSMLHCDEKTSTSLHKIDLQQDCTFENITQNGNVSYTHNGLQINIPDSLK